MSDPRIGVVLVNWNGADDTVVALESLLAATPAPTCAIVVDNGSEESSVARIEAWGAEHAPSVRSVREGERVDDAWLTIVRAGSNRGFSGGNNIGLRVLAARPEITHFLLLNNDAMVAPDYFARIGDVLREHPDAALVGCTIFHHPERDRVWYSGGYEVPWRALILHRYDTPNGTAPTPVPFVTGCAMLISRALYETQGGLAEVFNPIYWEDGDYSHRARVGGAKLLFAPAAVVYHRVRSTGGGLQTLTPRVAYLDNRNRGIFVRRNYRGVDRAMALLYLAVTKPNRALVEVLRGRAAVGSAIVRGWIAGLRAPIA